MLVDIDAQALEVMAAFARRLNEQSGARLIIEHTTDRARALPDADFVISSVAIKRNDLWRLALRNIPVLLDICRDMERLCPDALLLNFSNPESRLCLAVNKYTSIRSVGLCHGIFMGIESISRITGVPASDIDVNAAGLNHFTWMMSVHRKSTGEDLYPLLRQNSEDCDLGYLPLTRALFKAFGLFPSSHRRIPRIRL